MIENKLNEQKDSFSSSEQNQKYANAESNPKSEIPNPEPNGWEKVVEIFEQAVELAPAERSAFLNRVCPNEEVRSEIEAMLAADDAADEFIETPAVAAAATSLLRNKFSAPEIASPIGNRIGAYRLTGEIGRGGMGAVYAAERADGEFKKRVAIKLIRGGMDSDFIIRRFRRERQILAELNHPNIARLLDGGTTENNLPYLIMEFVEGDTLLEYAEKNHLTLEERLKLFEQICQAVEYAHRQNVLHRDLKPSNILVAKDGVPKLLDFGIAKLTTAEANHENTELTLTGNWLMTPEYASPEQVRGEPLTPSSDVYSLGIVLYNLVTGEPPYKFPSRAPHEIARVVCEVAPLRPLSIVSCQLQKTSNGGRRTTDNGQRATDDALERVILKSLRKEPSQRYQTAREFAEDIGNYLQGEPVAAIDYQNQTSVPEKKSERRRKISLGLLQIPFGILAAVVASLIDSGLNLGLPDKVPAFVFTGFLISAIWRVGYAFYQNPDEKLPERRRASAVREALVLRIPLGILATAVVALFDPALDLRLPDEVPALVFIGFLISAVWRVGYAFYQNPAAQPLDETDSTQKNSARETAERANDSSEFNEIPIASSNSGAAQRTLAVLPFRQLQGATDKDSDSEFLGIGLADALTTRLSNVRQIVVRPTSSVLQFAQTSGDPLALGKKLAVDFILDGSVAKTADRVRVSVQLLRVEDNSILWATQFDESEADIFALQDSISDKTVSSLVVQLTADEQERLQRRGTNNAAAFEAYLRGRYELFRYEADGVLQSIRWFQEAVRLDPNFALAYSGIADYYNWMEVYSFMRPSECWTAARQAATRAIELDPQLAEAYASLAFTVWGHDWDFAESERLYRRAIELNPNNARAHEWFAFLLQTVGRNDEAIEEMRRAKRLDPRSAAHAAGHHYVLFMARRYAEAEAEAERGLEFDPENLLCRHSFGWSSPFVGNIEKGIEAAREAVERGKRVSLYLTTLGYNLAIGGRQTEARAILREMEEREKGGEFFPQIYYAVIHAGLGEIDAAFARLEKNAGERDHWRTTLLIDPRLDPLREDARFSEYAEKIRPLGESKNKSFAAVESKKTPGKDAPIVSRHAGGITVSWRLIAIVAVGVSVILSFVLAYIIAENL